MPEKETRLSARQLVKSLKRYQLNELALLLAAIHEKDTAHSVDAIVYDELLAAGRSDEAEGFLVVVGNMVEVN